MANNDTQSMPLYKCTEVSDLCPVKATTLGYYPNFGLNVLLAVGFGIAAMITLVLGVWKKTWSYMAFIVAGSCLEVAGYGGRAALSSNPWNSNAFQTQICAIILAPTLICISIYLTIKHLCLAFNPSLSRVRPKLYPFIFVPADVSCLLIQAIGGALAASAGHDNMDLLEDGDHLIIVGIVLQVVVLLCFGVLSIDYYRRVKRWIHSDEVTLEAQALWHDKKFRMFVYAVMGAYCLIVIRCVYRIAEMAGGWGNYIMQNEPSFTVLDSFFVLITCLLLACFAPGILFPQMARNMAEQCRRKKEKKANKKAKKSGKAVNSGEESQDLEQGALDLEHEPKDRSTALSC